MPSGYSYIKKILIAHSYVATYIYFFNIVFSYAKQQEDKVAALKTEIDELKKINEDLREKMSSKDSKMSELKCNLAALRLIVIGTS